MSGYAGLLLAESLLKAHCNAHPYCAEAVEAVRSARGSASAQIERCDNALRDQFARAAMQTLLSAPPEDWPFGLRDETNSVSEASYIMADAMLAARAKGGAA